MREGQADVAILVALEEELCALRDLLPKNREVYPRLDPWVVYEATVSGPIGGKPIRIVFVRTTDMGQQHANTLCSQIIPRFSPTYVFVVGIAAAAKIKDPRLGDIVIGQKAYYYESEKITDKGCRPRHVTYNCSSLLINRAVAFKRENPHWFHSIKAHRPKEDSTADRPTYDHPFVREGWVASGENLIRSEKFMRKLVDNNDRIIAAEMESAGFCHAAEETGHRPKPDVLVIRAVTDYGDKTKGNVWREYACEAAAIYALGVIREQMASYLTEDLAPVGIRTIDAPMGVHDFYRVIGHSELFQALEEETSEAPLRNKMIEFARICYPAPRALADQARTSGRIRVSQESVEDDIKDRLEEFLRRCFINDGLFKEEVMQACAAINEKLWPLVAPHLAWRIVRADKNFAMITR